MALTLTPHASLKMSVMLHNHKIYHIISNILYIIHRYRKSPYDVCQYNFISSNTDTCPFKNFQRFFENLILTAIPKKLNPKLKVHKLDCNISVRSEISLPCNDVCTSLICFKHPPDNDSMGPKRVADCIIFDVYRAVHRDIFL
jgi:hypothetical protein